ncbi:MAG: LysR family transcriptional regulator [Oceanospirillum sp.]|nr:LysR family transcriptional regulator [Oceanospirillum sp.]
MRISFAKIAKIFFALQMFQHYRGKTALDQFKAIECFIAVAETGSFSKAAERLRLPVSSVSRQVTALESQLKAELLFRTTRQIRLTEVGQLYLSQCQDISERLTNAQALVNSYQSEPSGTLTISAMTSFGELVLTPLIEEFQQQYPQILIDAEFSDQVQDLTLKGIDLCFRGGPLPDKRLIAYKVMENQFYLCASPDYLQQYGQPKNLEDLEQHKAIYYRAPIGRMPWWIADDQGHRRCQLDTALITNSTSLLINSIVAGKGLCMLPMWAMYPYLEAGSLVQVEMENPPRISFEESVGIYLLYQQTRYQIPKVRCAVDFFRQKLAQLEKGHDLGKS